MAKGKSSSNAMKVSFGKKVLGNTYNKKINIYGKRKEFVQRNEGFFR